MASYVVSFSAFGWTPFNPKDGWSLLDHDGKLSPAPSDDLIIPPWKGWKEGEEQRGFSVRKYRTKTTSDGSELRFNYNHLLGRSYPNRFEISSRNNSQSARGFVDRAGQIVIPPKYERVGYFSNGYVPVREEKGKPWLILDENGKIAYSLPDDISPANGCRISKDRRLPVKRGDPGDKLERNAVDGWYDLEQKQFHPLGPYTVVDGFSEGLCRFNSVGPMVYGYADKDGQIVIPKQFDYASDFNSGLALVKLQQQFGYIDHSGKFVLKLPEEFLDVDEFHEDLAAVAAKDANGEIHWGFIDRTGKIVIEPQFWVADKKLLLSNRPRFSEGLAHVAVGDEIHHKYGFINKAGQWIIKPQFRDAQDFNRGEAFVRLGESGFDKVDWNKHNGMFVSRENLFKYFVVEHGLLGLSRSTLHEQLGKPDHSYLESDVYTLYSNGCGNAYKAVEIDFDGDKAAKYRYVRFEGHGDWIDKIGAEKSD